MGARRDLAVDDRLEAFALRDLAGDGQVDVARRVRASTAESSSRCRAGAMSVNADDPVSPARTASLTTRPSVESTFVVLKSVRMIGSCAVQPTRGEQRSERPDAERAQSHEHADERDERAERVHAAARRAIPAHVRRGLERERRDRAVRASSECRRA